MKQITRLEGNTHIFIIDVNNIKDEAALMASLRRIGAAFMSDRGIYAHIEDVRMADRLAGITPGDRIDVRISGRYYGGIVNGDSWHNGQPVIDFTEDNGTARFAYLSQITSVK